MTSYPIRIRIGNEYAGDPETHQFTDSTFAEAVTALQGQHVDLEGAQPGYHTRTVAYVVATYAEDHTEFHGPKRQIARKAGEPVFGFGVTVYGRDVSFGGAKDAETSRGSMGSLSTEQTRLMIDIETLALNLAIAANAEPTCSGCAPEIARYAERAARLAEG